MDQGRKSHEARASHSKMLSKHENSTRESLDSKTKIPSKSDVDAKHRLIYLKYTDDIQIKLSLNQKDSTEHTTDWLLHEGREKLLSKAQSFGVSFDPETLVTFRTADQKLPIDYWLTLPDKSLDILENKTVLFPFFKEKKDPSKKNRIKRRDFEIIKTIGRGGFSKVYLVRAKDNGKFYCLKSMKKGVTNVYQEVDQAYEREKVALSLIQHPFILNCRGSFESGNYSYLILDFLPGGDLKTLLNKVQALTEPEAKFYMAEILLAFLYLHENNFIYRDIKPENFLFDEEGHITLIDFGCTKQVEDKNALNYSYCGTIDYMTPEMVLKKGYDFTVDYYGLGVLLYEMVVGSPPFIKYTQEKDICHAIVNFKPVVPYKFSNNLRDLIMKLLEKDPHKRLGAKGGIKEIMDHPWFSEIAFGPLAEKKLRPTLKIDLKSMYFGPEGKQGKGLEISSEEAADDESFDFDDMVDGEEEDPNEEMKDEEEDMNPLEGVIDRDKDPEEEHKEEFGDGKDFEAIADGEEDQSKEKKEATKDFDDYKKVMDTEADHETLLLAELQHGGGKRLQRITEQKAINEERKYEKALEEAKKELFRMSLNTLTELEELPESPVKKSVTDYVFSWSVKLDDPKQKSIEKEAELTGENDNQQQITTNLVNQTGSPSLAEVEGILEQKV